MEAFVMFGRGKEEIVGCEEDDEDIGCASSGSLSTASDEVEELADDASSSGSATTHFEMASLMTQLPIKRGLSNFFDGKSQSFASLAEVGGLEDLPKPPASKRLKTSRSCGVGLRDAHHRESLLSAAGNKAASRARPRKLTVRTRKPPTTGVVAGQQQPLLFA